MQQILKDRQPTGSWQLQYQGNFIALLFSPSVKFDLLSRFKLHWLHLKYHDGEWNGNSVKIIIPISLTPFVSYHLIKHHLEQQLKLQCWFWCIPRLPNWSMQIWTNHNTLAFFSTIWIWEILYPWFCEGNKPLKLRCHHIIYIHPYPPSNSTCSVEDTCRWNPIGRVKCDDIQWFSSYQDLTFLVEKPREIHNCTPVEYKLERWTAARCSKW